MNVYQLFKSHMAHDMDKCVAKLKRHTEEGTFTGMAFVGYIEGRGWIADACGRARHEPLAAKDVLPALDKKLMRLARKK